MTRRRTTSILVLVVPGCGNGQAGYICAVHSALLDTLPCWMLLLWPMCQLLLESLRALGICVVPRFGNVNGCALGRWLGSDLYVPDSLRDSVGVQQRSSCCLHIWMQKDLIVQAGTPTDRYTNKQRPRGPSSACVRNNEPVEAATFCKPNLTMAGLKSSGRHVDGLA